MLVSDTGYITSLYADSADLTRLTSDSSYIIKLEADTAQIDTASITKLGLDTVGANGAGGITITGCDLGIGTDPTSAYLLHTAATGEKNISGFEAYSTNTSHCPQISLAKSHNNTIGTVTATVNTESFGRIEFAGANSSNALHTCAVIYAYQIGSAGANNETNIVFETNNSGGLSSNLLVLKGSGFNVGIGKIPDDDRDLHVYNSGSEGLEVESNTSDAYLYINSNTDSAGNEESGVILQDTSRNKWKIYKTTSNVFEIYDYVATSAALQISPDGDMTLSPSGNVDVTADTLSTSVTTASTVDTDTLKYAANKSGRSLYSLIKSSMVTIGHPGEATTDFAYTSEANSNEQTLGTDTIPAFARIIDVILTTTEAVAGITTDFTIDVGDGAGTDEYCTATDMKGDNAIIAGDASEAMLVMPIATTTIIYVNANPNAEDWDAMTAGEFTLITTYIDYGEIKEQ